MRLVICVILLYPLTSKNALASAFGAESLWARRAVLCILLPCLRVGLGIGTFSLQSNSVPQSVRQHLPHPPKSPCSRGSLSSFLSPPPVVLLDFSFIFCAQNSLASEHTNLLSLLNSLHVRARLLSPSAARGATKHWLAALANGAPREKATRAELCCATPHPQALQICNRVLLLFFLISQGSWLIWSWHQQEA